MTEQIQIVVVTGLSGAGRSTALHALEDLGFFCVDNLPPALAPRLLELASEASIARLGFGVDVRTGAFLSATEATFESLEAAGFDIRVVFLGCADEVLVRRFSETRRPHPLAPGGDLLKAIRAERERLAWLRSRADQVIDTTALTVHDLKRRLVDYVAQPGGDLGLVVRLVSFGFKYGLPVDADLVFDLRHLPNPHFVPELKAQSGLDKAVSDYVLEAEDTQKFLQHLLPLLEYALPRHAAEGKAYLTVALGCTGGRHRSVALVEALKSHFEGDFQVAVSHRDVDKARP